MLATVYAICRKSLVSETEASGNEFIDVAVYPDLINGHCEDEVMEGNGDIHM